MAITDWEGPAQFLKWAKFLERIGEAIACGVSVGEIGCNKRNGDEHRTLTTKAKLIGMINAVGSACKGSSVIWKGGDTK